MSLSGDRIRDCRIRHHLTQDDVAKYLGIGKQAVYKYEIGAVTNIPLENLEKMATLFNTTPEYLAGWTDDADEKKTNEPHTNEARIISGGVVKMPPEQRELARKVLQTVFSQYADYFKKGDDDE